MQRHNLEKTNNLCVDNVMKVYRGVLEMMEGSVPPAPLPPAPVQLSGQEDLEAWLEDLESVLYPAPPGNPSEDSRKLSQLWLEDIDSVLYPSSTRNPSEDSRKLSQLWLEDIDSVLYPSSTRNPSEDSRKLSQLWLGDIDSVLYPSSTRNPSEDSRKLSQLWLDDLESVLYPSAVGNPSEDSKKLDQPPQFTQPESRSPEHRDQSPVFCPLEVEVNTSDILSTIDLTQREDIFKAFSAESDPVNGSQEESEPGATGPPPREPSPLSSSSANSPSQSCGRRGAKRRRAGGCACTKAGRGGKEQGQERQVAELSEENERLRGIIAQLTAEVQEARRRLIEKMVNVN